MKIVNTGIKYQIYDDSLRTFTRSTMIPFAPSISCPPPPTASVSPSSAASTWNPAPICRSTKRSMARMNPRSKKL